MKKEVAMYSHAFAGTIASELMASLSPYCESLHDSRAGIAIVGSLRRLKQKVNDIDIIAIPKFVDSKDDSLFGEPVKENLLDIKLGELCMDGCFTLESNGEKIKRFLKHVDHGKTGLMPIDLYIATPSTWSTLMLIRTGSREHNIKLASRALELHMQLKADGSGLISPGGTLIQIHSEEEIFCHLKLQFKKPSERN